MVAVRHFHGRLERDPFARRRGGDRRCWPERKPRLEPWAAPRRPRRCCASTRPANMARRASTPGQLAVLGRNCPSAQLIAAHGGAGRAPPRALQPADGRAPGAPDRRSSRLWNVAGFALGAATALISEKAAMACTDAVETEIDRHYGASWTSWATTIPSWRRHRRFPGRGAGASRHGARSMARRKRSAIRC